MPVDPARLECEYRGRRPDVGDPNQLVRFGSSGHRGSPLRGTFTEAHILAIAQAIRDDRRGRGIDGPLYPSKDTHAGRRGRGMSREAGSLSGAGDRGQAGGAGHPGYSLRLVAPISAMRPLANGELGRQICRLTG